MGAVFLYCGLKWILWPIWLQLRVVGNFCLYLWQWILHTKKLESNSILTWNPTTSTGTSLWVCKCMVLGCEVVSVYGICNHEGQQSEYRIGM